LERVFVFPHPLMPKAHSTSAGTYPCFRRPLL
jgi:hypothetical protein